MSGKADRDTRMSDRYWFIWERICGDCQWSSSSGPNRFQLSVVRFSWFSSGGLPALEFFEPLLQEHLNTSHIQLKYITKLTLGCMADRSNCEYPVVYSHLLCVHEAFVCEKPRIIVSHQCNFCRPVRNSWLFSSDCRYMLRKRIEQHCDRRCRIQVYFINSRWTPLDWSQDVWDLSDILS